MKKIICNILFLTMITVSTCYASAPTRPKNYTPNTTIASADVTVNETTLYSYLQTGVDTYAAGSISNAAISPTAGIQYSKLTLTGSILPADIATGGFLLPSGAVFFMATGSCPSGTTDISATYANKYVKINATQLTSSGVVLTGTTDSHTLSIAEMPAHSHLVDRNTSGSAFGNATIASSNNGSVGANTTTDSVGGGGGHTHTLSTATTLEPSSITMRLCQVS